MWDAAAAAKAVGKAVCCSVVVGMGVLKE